jgi:hypothetical protein
MKSRPGRGEVSQVIIPPPPSASRPTRATSASRGATASALVAPPSTSKPRRDVTINTTTQ